MALLGRPASCVVCCSPAPLRRISPFAHLVPLVCLLHSAVNMSCPTLSASVGRQLYAILPASSEKEWGRPEDASLAIPCPLLTPPLLDFPRATAALSYGSLVRTVNHIDRRAKAL